jgi:hypothetical protein
MRDELRVQLFANEADPKFFRKSRGHSGTFLATAPFLHRARV